VTPVNIQVQLLEYVHPVELENFKRILKRINVTSVLLEQLMLLRVKLHAWLVIVDSLPVKQDWLLALLVILETIVSRHLRWLL